MKRLLLAGSVLILAGLFGACGGGANTDHSLSGGEQTTTVVDPAVLALRAKREEFRRYLARTREALKAYRKAQRLDARALALVVERSPGVADRREAARLLLLDAARFEQSALLQLQARPPASLRAINRRFATRSTRFGANSRSLAVAIVEHDWVAAWNSVPNLPDSAVRAEWRVEVDAYARQLGLRLPGWARIIGTPGP